MKYIKLYNSISFDNSLERSEPDFYIDSYTTEEQRRFLYWYYKIKPHLDNYDKYGAAEILSDYDEEELSYLFYHRGMKIDLYSLVHNYFKRPDVIKNVQLKKDTKNYNL